jgi:hypothetical protein
MVSALRKRGVEITGEDLRAASIVIGDHLEDVEHDNSRCRRRGKNGHHLTPIVSADDDGGHC